MKKVNVEVNVLINDMKKDTEEIIKNQENITKILEGLLSEESKRELEEFYKLPPEEQRRLNAENIERMTKEFREYIKGGDYIG